MSCERRFLNNSENHGSSVKQAASNLEINDGTLKFWVQAHRSEHGIVSAVEEQDLRKRNAALERENQQSRMERESLRKEAAFFAREQA